jgi:DNA-binding NarL/FixJ family response regulator
MDKTILLIDDSVDQKGVLENLSEHLRRKEGINLITLYINPNERNLLDEEDNPNLENLIQEAVNRLKSNRPSLVVVDYYYSDCDFNGLNVIEKLRSIKKFQKCPIFLISGKRNKIVKEIFQDKELQDSQKVNELSKIINFGINKFLDKEFKSEAIELLKKNNLNEILPIKLRELENGKLHLFKSLHKEIPISELADKIDSDDPETPEIIEEIFEITLSHYLKIDEKLS